MEPLNLIPTVVPLKELLRQFDRGDYKLPAFQRPFVWRIRQTLMLLDSLLRGYPIGVIYLWEPGPYSKLQPKGATFRRRGRAAKVDRFRAFVIDGQQRLTSLHAAFGFAEAFDRANGRSLECWLELDTHDRRDGRVTSLFRSPAQVRFLHDPQAQQRAWRVRLRDLLDKPHQRMRAERAEQLALSGRYDEEEIENALQRLDAAYRMLSAPITCMMVTQSDDEEVLAVFKRLNRGGTGLRERDVRAADLGIGTSVDVLREMQSFVEEPKAMALGFGFSFAFRALVVFHKGTAQFNQLPPKWAEADGDRGQTLTESWREARKGLSAAMELVDQIGWSRRPLLPSCNGLIPLSFALVRLGRRPSQREREAVTRWYCLAALRGVFQGGVETTINKHIRSIKQARNSVRGLLNALSSNQTRRIKADELMRQPTTLWGPYSQVMFAWLVSMGAKDWMTGQPLHRVARLGADSRQPEETLTIQHIFPRQLLSDLGYEPDQANYPANFAIIGRAPNSSLQDLPPTDAYERLDSHSRREHASVQFFSKDAGDLLQTDRYEEFLEWRAKRLAEAWNEWLDLK